MMPNQHGPGHETSPPPLATGAPGALHHWAPAFIAFESIADITFHHRTNLQRSRFGGVCCLCPTPTSGEHHG